MAITWGAYVNNSTGNGMRLGYEFSQSPSSVGSGTSSVTVTVGIWMETKASVFDSTNNFSISGSWSASGEVNISHGSGGGVTKVRSYSRTVSTSYTDTRSTSFTAQVNGINAIPGTASVSGSWTTAKRPYQAPTAPSNVILSLSGDGGYLKWTRRPSSSAPYDSIELDFQRDDGTWQDSATLSGGASSYTTGTFVRNSSYQYRVRAHNSAGTSAWAYSNTVKAPPNAPAAPSNANVSRSSDTRQIVTWSRGSSTSTAPITNQVIARQDVLGAGSYVNIATVSGTATSFTDSSTRANKQYRYRVQSKNSSGTSSWAYTDYISTTPNSPTNVKAKKQGEDIQVTWTNTTGTRITGIEVWLTADGVDQSPVHVLLNGSPTSWTHVSPDPSKTWAYRLKTQSGADSNDAAPNLYSAFSARTNTVHLIAPPNAPTLLKPSSSAIDADEVNIFTWQHNPIDTTDQTGYELRHRTDGGTWVTITDMASGFERRTFAEGTFTNGTTLEWQVRTWGAHVDPSAWSAIAVVTISARPSATIITPDGSTGTPNILSSDLLVEWDYFDPETTNQTGVRIRLDDANGEQVWASTLNMSSTGYDVPYRLADGASYTVSVSVRDASGLWSAESAQPFNVTYAKPPAPTIDAVWDLDLGGVVVNIEHPAPAPMIDYQWTGTVDNSASVRMQGTVETARNLAPDPRSTNPALYRSTGNLSLGTIDEESCVFFERTTGASQVVIDTQYYSDTYGFQIGDKIYWSADVRVTTIMDVQLHVSSFGGGAEDTASEITRQYPTDGWVRHYAVSTITDNVSGSYFEYRIHEVGNDIPSGEGFYFRNMSIQQNNDAGYFSGSTPDIPGEVEATSADLQHSADGEEWTTVAAGLDPSTSAVDFIPILDTVNYYRIVSYSDLPSSLESAAVPVVVESKGWVFVNGGPDWSYICRMRDNVTTDDSPERTKILNHFAGRKYPVMTSGESRDRSISISGRTSGGGSTDKDWEDLYDLGDPVCYRAPGPAYGGAGDRFIVAFQNYSRSRDRRFEDVSMTFQRVEEV